MSKRELVIVAEAHSAKKDGYKSLWKRRYARLDTAIPRIMQVALLDQLKPLETVTFYHAYTGLEIGVLTVHVGGKVTVMWIWD